MDAYKHHFIQEELEIPSKYKYIRRAWEQDGMAAIRLEQRVRNDFMGNSNNRLVLPFFSKGAFIANDVISVRDTRPYTEIPLDPQVYDRIKPALRLASILIQRHLSFWLLILYGQENTNANGEKYLDEGSLTPAWIANHTDQFLNTDLPSMASWTRIGWHPKTDHTDVGMTTAAYTVPAHRPQDRDFMLLMSCAADVWAPFQTNSDWDQLIHEQRCNSWVYLAVTLVHEFAHCLHFYRNRLDLFKICRQTDRAPLFDPDPLISSLYPDAELGYAWEMSAFGGVIDVMTSTRARPANLAPSIFIFRGMNIPQLRLLQWNDVKHAYHADIAPETMMAFMQEDTWKKDEAVDIYLSYLKYP